MTVPRSSTSSSRRLTATRAIAVLLSVLVAYLCVLEVATAAAMKRLGRGTRRVYEDYSVAVRLRPVTAGTQKTVLMVGNSLLLAGVERQKLAAAMLPEYSVALWPIEKTSYLDWYFGLRRLLAEGSRPSVIVLCLSPRQLVMDMVMGESFAHRLMQLRDLLDVKAAAGLDRTTTSELFFANLSSWVGDRTSVRNRILEAWLPHAELLTKAIAPPEPPVTIPNPDHVQAVALQRLRALADLAMAHGSRFVFLIPPLTEERTLAERIQTAARQNDVAVLVPYGPGELTADNFSDGFHLNTQGAHAFTERLAPQLETSLDEALGTQLVPRSLPSD